MAIKRKKKGHPATTEKAHTQRINNVYQDLKLLSKKIWADFKKNQDVPTMHQKLFDGIKSGRAKRSEQVKFHCLVCKNWVRGDIEQCRETRCPVFEQVHHAKQLNRGIILSVKA